MLTVSKQVKNNYEANMSRTQTNNNNLVILIVIIFYVQKNKKAPHAFTLLFRSKHQKKKEKAYSGSVALWRVVRAANVAQRRASIANWIGALFTHFTNCCSFTTVIAAIECCFSLCTIFL